MSELWQRPLLLAVALLVMLGLLAWVPRRVVATRGVALLRCLLPSWQFFEKIESVPALHYRVAAGGDAWGAWQDALPVPARTARSLWLNPAGNLYLASRSLVEHLLAELEDAASSREARRATELVSYRLLCALVELRARAALPPGAPLCYQFRLLDAESADSAMFLSAVHGST